MTRLTKISLFILKMTKADDRSELLDYALKAAELCQAEETEKYLRDYYEGKI